MNSVTTLLQAKPKARDILDHSPELIEGLTFSSQEFYQRLDVALLTRNVPGVTVSRVDFSQGGPLAPHRQYYRCRRERLIYDICAMPFGTGFVVSEWFWEKPQLVGLAALLVAFLIIAVVWSVVTRPFNVVYLAFWRDLWGLWGVSFSDASGLTTLVLLGVPLLVTLVQIVWHGEQLDAMLIQIPLIGYIYERFFRRITYYRVDCTSAFRAAVHAAVSEVVTGICAAQGIPLRGEFALRPINRELQTTISIPNRRLRSLV